MAPEPQSIAEAFAQGYNISTDSEAEKMAFLHECDKLGICWYGGVNALDFIPRARNVVFAYYTDIKEMSFSSTGHLGGRAVAWAYLRSLQQHSTPMFVY